MLLGICFWRERLEDSPGPLRRGDKRGDPWLKGSKLVKECARHFTFVVLSSVNSNVNYNVNSNVTELG